MDWKQLGKNALYAFLVIVLLVVVAAGLLFGACGTDCFS